MKMNIESLTPACKLDRYEMKYVFVRTNLRTTHLIFSLFVMYTIKVLFWSHQEFKFKEGIC